MNHDSDPPHPDLIVLHIAGADRPGVTAKLAEVIASEGAELVNIGQSVLHGFLMMSIVVRIPEGSRALRRILFAVNKLGLRMELNAGRAIDETGDGSAQPGLCVTALGPLGSGSAIGRVTRYLADKHLNIREIRSLSDQGLTGVELIADLPPGLNLTVEDLEKVRGELLTLGGSLGVDMAVQRDDIFRRTKRLVCMDVDSTFVKGEFIDELAELAGVKDRVAGITKRAMAGELDFKAALAERVKLLEGVPLEKVIALTQQFELTDGAERFAKVLKSLGFSVGLVSGGFDIFVDKLRERYGLDFAFANELEVKDGRLTGRVTGTVVDPERKAQVLRDMAKVSNCRLEQTVAIGDGANDVLMLQTAGLGIAYHGKPKLQEVADMSLNHNPGIDALLYLMGFKGRDLAEL